MHVAMSVENSVFVQSHPLTRVDVPYLNLALSSATEEMHLQQHADSKSEPAAARTSSSSASRVSPLRSRSELHSHPRLNIATSTVTRPTQIISSFARAFKDLQYISSTSDPSWLDSQRRHADAAQLQLLDVASEATPSSALSSVSACGANRPEQLPEFRADEVFPNLLTVRGAKPRMSNHMSPRACASFSLLISNMHACSHSQAVAIYQTCQGSLSIAPLQPIVQDENEPHSCFSSVDMNDELKNIRLFVPNAHSSSSRSVIL
jgi:hypothetical protein